MEANDGREAKVGWVATGFNPIAAPSVRRAPHFSVFSAKIQRPVSSISANIYSFLFCLYMIAFMFSTHFL